MLGVSFTTPHNTIDTGSIDILWEAAEKAEADFESIVIWNEGANFCVGANLGSVVMAAMNQQWDDIAKLVEPWQWMSALISCAPVSCTTVFTAAG